jgi:hypothetical protein
MTAHKNHSVVRAVLQRHIRDPGRRVGRRKRGRERRGVKGRSAGRCPVDDFGDNLRHTERVDIVKKLEGWQQ